MCCVRKGEKYFIVILLNLMFYFFILIQWNQIMSKSRSTFSKRTRKWSVLGLAGYRKLVTAIHLFYDHRLCKWVSGTILQWNKICNNSQHARWVHGLNNLPPSPIVYIIVEYSSQLNTPNTFNFFWIVKWRVWNEKEIGSIVPQIFFLFFQINIV